MKYYLIAGEASGDLHGSNLIKGLKEEDSHASFRFFGGGMMVDAVGSCGDECLVHHYKDDAVMGFTDVLKRGRKLLGNVEYCKRDIEGWNPDVVILIDYPGFNFKIAKFAHKNGFKVFWYIAPKTWASRESRNRKLKKYIDKLFIIFPFEIPYFEEKCIPFIYKGNPLLDAVDNHNYSRVCAENYIALLPGSRKGEIQRMMPICMDAARKLRKKIVIAAAPSRTLDDYKAFIKKDDDIEIVFSRTYDILKYADAAIINSGTASLEAALIGTPQVVCWSSSALTIFVAKHIFKVSDHIKYISLGNLILSKLAFKELIQDDFTSENVCVEVKRLLEDETYSQEMTEDYKEIRKALGGDGASRQIAGEMVSILKGLS